MASQTLETIIAINARVGNGFSQVGQTLTELGSIVNGVSQQLIQFGEESIEVYKDYEKSMRDAEVALSTNYGRNTKELSDAMETLDAAATEWAATTIFHTNDVGNAISEAAHAGWDLNEIMTGLPAAMQLAQAGGLDLSEAVNYIVKSTNAAGIEFKDLGNFIDLWTFAANSSASTIGEFGDAMLRMGSTMRWAANPEELMTLIAATANAGSVGSEAGTMIRNSIMRLVAPTDKAKKALGQLGATATEVNEVMGDENLVAAYEALTEHGFQGMFDDKGNIRNILDVYSELAVVLGDMSGGIENISKNEQAMSILSSIFPTRTITEALNLITAASKNYDDLYDKMQNGDAVGYGQYAAETEMDTLYGKMETFESKVERLKQLVGGELKGDVETVLGGLGGFVDNLATMDKGAFDAIVAGLEVLAVAGPGLLLTGGAFRLIGTALSWTGGLPVAAIALAAIVASVKELEDADFEGKFGNMNLDESQIYAYLGGIKQAFIDANAEITGFDEALNTALENYETASSGLSSTLVSDMLTGVSLDPESEEYKKLMKLGDNMSDALRAGIDANYQEIMASLTGTFGEEGVDDPVWNQIMSVIEQGHQADVARAKQLSQELRDAMTSAFSDGSLTAEEIGNIRKIQQEMDQLFAEQRDREHYVEQQKMLRKARTLGLSTIVDTAASVKAERDAEMEDLLTRYDQDYYDTMTWYQKAIDEGWMVPDLEPDAEGNYGEHKATKEDMDAALSRLKEEQKEGYMSWMAAYSDFLFDLYNEGIEESDLDKTWDNLKEFAQSFRESGGIVTQAAKNKWESGNNQMDIEQTHQYLESMVDAMGGMQVLQDYVDYFTEHGDVENAKRYQQLVDMYNILGGMAHIAPETGSQGQGIGDYSDVDGYTVIKNLLEGAYGEGTEMTPRYLAKLVEEAEQSGMPVDWQSVLGEELWSQFNAKAQQEAQGDISRWIKESVGAQAEEFEQTDYQAAISELEKLKKQQEVVDQKVKDNERTLRDQNKEPWWDSAMEALYGPNRDAKEGLYAEQDALAARIAELETEIANMQEVDESKTKTPAGDNVQEEPEKEEPKKEESGKTFPEAIGFIASAGISDVGGMGRPSSTSGTEVSTEGVAKLDKGAGNAGTELQGTAEAADNTQGSFNQFIQMLDLGGAKAETFGDKVKGAGMTLDEASDYFTSVGSGLDIITGSAGEAAGGLDNVAGSAGEAAGGLDGVSSGAGEAAGSMGALASGASHAAGVLSSIKAPSFGSILGRLFAEGGRADEPSIFGEGENAEWAIPEEHSQRTAELLNAARAASGFTWPELLDLFGGLNANPQNTPTTIVYSPTINANDASGVEQVLKDDKRRFEKWFEDKQMRDAAEVYA